MYIDSLDIIRGTDDKLLRQIKFHMGTNIITDDQNLETHNGAGKTTALRLLDIVLGSRDKKHLYTDKETGNINKNLQQFIEKSKITISCKISDTLPAANAANVHTLTVELYTRGRRSIDETPYALKAYHAKLNELIFSNADNKPAFRQLISPFLRISLKGDNDAFLYCLDPHTKNIEYRSVYDFLYDIPNCEINDQFEKANDEFTAFEKAKKRYCSVNGISDQNLEKQNQLLVAVQDEASVLSRRLNDIMKPEDFQKNRDSITKVRDAYEKVNKELSDVQYQIRLNKESLKQAVKEKNDAPKIELMKRFYDEIHELQPSIRKTFDDLIAFNKQLGENEIDYFTAVGEQLDSKEKEILAHRANIEAKNERFLALLNKADVSEYEDLQNKLSMVQKRVGQQQEILDTLKHFDEELRKLNKIVNDLQQKLTENNEIPINTVHFFTYTYFKPLTNKINGEKPVLTYNSGAKKFPLAITDLDKGTSTGKRKSLIIAYDFAYQEYAAAKHKPVPRFVVHDVLESIEEDALKEAVDIANDSDFQYITAILHSKLESDKFDKQELKEMVVLTLSEDDRLFKDNQTPDEAALFS